MYTINGVALSAVLGDAYLTEETMWRPDVSAVRSPVVVPGRHGSIEAGLPVFGEPKLKITVTARPGTGASLEAAVGRLTALFAAPALTVTRAHGGVTASTPARLESIAHGGFLWGARSTLTVTLGLPGVFFADDAGVSIHQITSWTGATAGVNIPHLEGSTAPIGDAIVRIKGPAEDVTVRDDTSGTGIDWEGSLGAGIYLYLSPRLARAWTAATDTVWEPGGTDATSGLSWPAPGVLQLWPTVSSLSTRTTVAFTASASSRTMDSAIAIRAGKTYL